MIPFLTKEEINKLLEEYDDKHMALALELNAYEKERREQEGKQQAMKFEDEVILQLGQEPELN